jgi:beta-galactosidase
MFRHFHLARLGIAFTWLAGLSFCSSTACADAASPRQTQLLNSADWQFVGAGAEAPLPEIDSDAFGHAAWTKVSVPHNFQTRAAYDTLTRGWYRTQVTVSPSAIGKALYLVFEGAATIADVYVNGQHLGQHRGAYTRFVFDASKALHPGSDNQLAVLVNDTPADTLDCLPISKTGLYKVWGGLYRNVWLVETAQVHIDPTDYASPGVYITPADVSGDSAKLTIRVLLRNVSTADAQLQVRARILDPAGAEVKTVVAPASIAAGARGSVELSTVVANPQLWGPLKGAVYHVETTVLVNGQPVDEVTQPTGFRWLDWDWKGGTVKVNGKRVILYGVNLHQEVEAKGSAVSPEDLKANFDTMADLGNNFLRLPHYPHAQIEYDLADQHGILAWAEDGNSNGKDVPGPTAAQIATEMVKQNYNHPSIVVWSLGNEAAAEPADQCVPIVKALDQTRPVGVANQKSALADFHTKHCYFGWYHKDLGGFTPTGFMSEVGAGGVVSTHCDYDKVDWNVNKYEPEEWQQFVSENNFQKVFHGDNSTLGLFCVWCLRDFSDGKYKAPVGINSKGLITYAGSKKDVYYLYRSFLRPETPTVWICSKRYFLRRGEDSNGIKVYSNAARITLTLNGEKVSTLENGNYVIPDGPWTHEADTRKVKKGDPVPKPAVAKPYTPEKVDNVFFWPARLHTGKNTVTASDDHGNTDTAVIYFYGENGLPELPTDSLPITRLVSSNTRNPAYFMGTPVQGQWPIYYDLDSTADNSWNTLPEEIDGASWIALRRVTKPEEATTVSFTVNKPSRIYVMATKKDTPPAFAPAGTFQEVPQAASLWRDNAMLLVPSQLFVHEAKPGEEMHLSLGDRDAVVLVK